MRYQTARFSYAGQAEEWLAKVETADGQTLETALRDAYKTYVNGLISDGIWNSINVLGTFCCARTLSGLMIPIKGPTITDSAINFTLSDLIRKTGLKSNGTKIINTNYSQLSDPQNDFHMSTWVTEAATTNYGTYIGTSPSSAAHIGYNNGPTAYIYNRSSGNFVTPAFTTGFVGTSRNSSANFQYLAASGSALTYNKLSTGLTANNFFLFAQAASGSNFPGNGRIALWSIGRALDLTLLRARQITLMNTLNSIL